MQSLIMKEEHTLIMSENKALRKIIRSKKHEVRNSGYYITINFMIHMVT